MHTHKSNTALSCTILIQKIMSELFMGSLDKQIPSGEIIIMLPLQVVIAGMVVSLAMIAFVAVVMQQQLPTELEDRDDTTKALRYKPD
jgi:hypothetical protein